MNRTLKITIWILIWLALTSILSYLSLNIVNILYKFGYFKFPNEPTTIETIPINLFTYGSGLASIIGLIIVFYQIESIKSISIIAKETIQKTINSTNKTKTLTSIKSIQLSLNQAIEKTNEEKYQKSITKLYETLDEYTSIIEHIPLIILQKYKIPEYITEIQRTITILSRLLLKKNNKEFRIKIKVIKHLHELKRSFICIQNELERENIENLIKKD